MIYVVNRIKVIRLAYSPVRRVFSKNNSPLISNSQSGNAQAMVREKLWSSGERDNTS